MKGIIDRVIRDAVQSLLEQMRPGERERTYHHELARHTLTGLRPLTGVVRLPESVQDLVEHANVMRYAPGWGARSCPRADLFVWRPKDCHKRIYSNVLCLADCVAVELKLEDGDADRGRNRLKWIPTACGRLGLPVPPEETDGVDYTETESTLIALRAYRYLLGVGHSYLLLIGVPGNFKLRLLAERVRVFDEQLWEETPAGVPYLFREIDYLWQPD